MTEPHSWRDARWDSSLIAQADNPWLDWLEAVGISEGFPALRSLRRPIADRDELGREHPNDDSRRWFLNRPHLQKLHEIYESLSAARVVTTATGHGATTLARYLYQKADEDTLLRRSVPVLLSLEDVLDVPYDELLGVEREALRSSHPELHARRYSEDADGTKSEADTKAEKMFDPLTTARLRERIEKAVHTAVVRSLVTRPWERAMPRGRYRELLDAASPQPADLVARRQDLARFVTDGTINDSAWSLLKERAPRLVPEDYRELVAELANACGVRISLLLDLSATPAGRLYVNDAEGEYLTEAYLNVLSRTAAAIKNIEQSGGRGPRPTLPSLLDKTYIMSGDAWIEFQRDYTAQEDSVIEFPSLRPIDVFAMLAYHYPPHQHETGRRAEALAAVVDSTYVRISPSRALSTEMAVLESELSHRVTQTGDVTYQLMTPDADSSAMRAVVEAIIALAREAGTDDVVKRLRKQFTWIEKVDDEAPS